MRIHTIIALSLTCMGFLFLGFLTAYAADHRNLEENHPTRIEDAYPIAYRSFELQSRGGWNSSQFPAACWPSGNCKSPKYSIPSSFNK